MAASLKRPLEIEDLYAIRLVSEPTVSPDGNRVVWVVTTIDKDADTYKAALWLASLDGSNARQLTSGSHRDTAPRWAPDGRSIAFVSNRPATITLDDDAAGQADNGKKQVSQIWLISPDGGEARQLTSHPNGASSISWSPDSRRIAFTAADDVTADDLFTAPATVGVHADEVIVNDIRYRGDGKGLLRQYTHIWAIDVTSGESVQLTNADANDASPEWSPDGRLIAFIGNRRADRRMRSAHTVQVVPANGGEVRTIAPDDALFDAISWSPDGKRLAFIGHEDATVGSSRNKRVWSVSVDGTDLRNHTKDLDITFADAGMSDLATGGSTSPIWLDDSTLLVTGSSRGATSVYQVALKSGEAQALTPDTQRILQFDLAPDDKTLVYIAGEIDRPFRLCSSTIKGKKFTTIHDPNEGLVGSAYLAEPIELDATAPDGGAVQAWLLPPRGLDPSDKVKYPLIVQIHGGPHSMYGRAMFHEMQVMASRGYGVLFCNPRGSSGYGEAFTGVTRGTWGESDMPDVIAAVEKASALPWVDTERLGITGGSYGGYLTNWIIGHDTRFRAAVTQRCVSNFHSFVGTSDIGFDFGIFEFGGTPWADAEMLLKYSPISYVANIETPLLIIHSEKDLRCPIEQAEQMFTALKYLGKDVGFARIPEESHELSRSGTPSRRIARLRHLI
ncbi:MAG TPA: S9 family peptidase, partial [Thermomicrobiales bacterium]|nr:S9 family peptidase [Thermomicrobiales bacterium]